MMCNASEQVKASIASTSEERLTKTVGETVSKSGLDPTKIQSVKKAPTYGLRLCCPSEEAAYELHKLDWETNFNGATLVRLIYGIVMHGVSKKDIEFEHDTQEEIKSKIEHSNLETIKVTKVTPLRKRTKNAAAPTQSIVLSTLNLTEANECIIYGINIEYRHYTAEQYVPQCQTRQCFKCQGYGHIAYVCTRETKREKCSQSHEIKNCSINLLQYVHCKGPHTAWHHECPAQQKERQR